MQASYAPLRSSALRGRQNLGRMPTRSSAVRVQAMSSTKAPKLYYFDLPGRAETTRLLFTLAKHPFEDYRFGREEWAELKPKMPFGQVPVLEVDGKLLSQSGAIERYAAKLTGLYPTDPWEAALVDQVVGLLDEFITIFIPSFYMQDPEQKRAARLEVVDTKLKPKLSKLNAMLEASGPDGFLTGPKMTYADVAAFVTLSNMISGFFDGIPQDLYEAFPAVKSFHTRVASMPEIAAFYAPYGEGTNRYSFRADFKPTVAAA